MGPLGLNLTKRNSLLQYKILSEKSDISIKKGSSNEGLMLLVWCRPSEVSLGFLREEVILCHICNRKKYESIYLWQNRTIRMLSSWKVK